MGRYFTLSLTIFIFCRLSATPEVSPPLIAGDCDRDVITCKKVLMQTGDPENSRPSLRLKQITGKGWKAGDQVTLNEEAVADPASPLIDSATGEATVYGTGWAFLKWRSIQDFLRGTKPQVNPLQLYHPTGKPLSRSNGETPWDILVKTWGEGAAKTEVLYAGVMTPLHGESNAEYPEDNWSRRIYPFVKNAQGNWVRRELPLFNDIAADAKTSMLGHCYGHDFIEDENGQTWLFYEKVDADWGGRTRTQIYTRKMRGPYRADEKETLVLGVGDPTYPAAQRGNGGTLVEGPRVKRVEIRGQVFYLMGFSAGDFPTDHYGGYFAVSKKIDGPYLPLTKGNDLFDLGAEIKRIYRLSWGPARPVLVREPDTTKWWVVFHAIDKDVYPNQDFSFWPESLTPFHRNLYIAPLAIDIGNDGKLQLQIQDDSSSMLSPRIRMAGASANAL